LCCKNIEIRQSEFAAKQSKSILNMLMFLLKDISGGKKTDHLNKTFRFALDWHCKQVYWHFKFTHLKRNFK